MAMKAVMWCDLCPTLLELEAFEAEIKTRQMLPYQEHGYQIQRLHLCSQCFDKVQAHVKPLKQQVSVTAQIVGREAAPRGSKQRAPVGGNTKS